MAAIEFALVLPAAVLLLLGGTDLAIWITDWFRLERAASETADITARAYPLYAANFTAAGGYFAIAQQIAKPLAVAGQGGATIISGIVNNGTTTTIAWQQVNTTNAAYTSKFGTVGQAPTLPVGYAVPSGEMVIAAEIYSGIHPWMLSFLQMGTTGPDVAYVYSLYAPRSGEPLSLQ